MVDHQADRVTPVSVVLPELLERRETPGRTVLLVP